MSLTIAAADEAAALARVNLQTHAEQARGAFASNTERATRSDVAIFLAWCRADSCVPMPAAPDSVARFVDFMGEAKAPATVRRYISSISTFHRAAGMPNPVTDRAVTLALKRLHRAKGRAQVQAAPLTRQLVHRMLKATPESTVGRRNRALLAVAYDTLARRSELVALHVEDLERGPDGSGTVLVRRSKVDQEGMGEVRYLAPDTMRHLSAWLVAAQITEGPIFRAAAGVSAKEAARISGHSSRVGAAQDMARHGLELPTIMRAGGWRTAGMVARYTARLDARRSGAAKLAVLQDRG